MRPGFKVFCSLFLVLAIIALATCSATPAAQPASAKSANQILQNGKPIRFISPNRQHPVVRTMALGFWEACAHFQVDCVDNSFDGVDMSNMVTEGDIAIAQGSSGTVIFVDKTVYETDKKVIAAGIPAVADHVHVLQGDAPGLLAWVAADATDYAQRAAVALGTKLGGKGTVALTQGSLNDVENEVTAAFTKTMAEKFPSIKVLEPQMEGFDPTQAIALCVTILQAHPDVTGAFGTTGGSPTSWAKALEQVGKKPGEVAVIGMDTTLENLDLVKSGEVYALVSQPLYDEVYKAVEILVKHLQGKPVSYDNMDPAPIVTKAELDTYYSIQDRVNKLPTEVPTKAK
jgi:ribose transport system substrate-binding protein